MLTPDTTNKMFQVAEEMVCGSNATIFLTGKAGTGKTTFLKYIKKVCDKNLAVVAPTGVAAINAGGTTIHSFFQLPFTPFNYNDTALFFGKLKINSERRQVFRQLELLIIDEISMVRADLLDAIDVLLRHFRFRYAEPFGGVQVLMIGDMYQLSPVVRDDEWSLISGNYRSHYFFDSRVMQQAPPVHIAFDKIYRQQDERFVNLLNQVRNNELDKEGLRLLEKLYQPHFQPSQDDEHIILTTHNNKADAVNKERLSRLPAKSQTFIAEIKGEFSDRSFPAEEQLVLKEGARVMFIKNDTEKVRRYFNGKIGVITKIAGDEIFVLCSGDEDAIEVKKETWENIRYSINKTNQQLEEDVLGSFTQYPLRLAWAVTIHKSQGLTFDKVVVDAGAAFTPGQVYVALSRCTNMEGVVLLSAIPKHRLANDNRIVEFSQSELAHERLQELLQNSKKAYQQKILLDTFDFSLLVNDAQSFLDNTKKYAEAFNADLLPSLEKLLELLKNLQTVSGKFCHYMKARFVSDVYPEQNEELQNKIKAAVVHFKKEMIELRTFFKIIKAVTDSKMIAKDFNDSYKNLYIQTALKYHLILACAEGFFIATYYNAKKDFVAPAVSVNAYATASTSSFTPCAHPQLYQQLRELRDELCNRNNIPVYLVASGKTLDELVMYLPQSKTELQKISGFGKVNVEKYGNQFLSIINLFCLANNLSSQIDKKIPKRERKKKDSEDTKEASYKISLALFKEGFSVAEIAKKRNFAISTIEGHLATCVGDGDIDPVIFINSEKLQQILNEQTLIAEQGMVAAKNKLGDSFSFFDMRVAMQVMKSKEDKSEAM
ncbi:MAG: helix-turn-helix domain-containing protein [Bacteroidota bacterium]|nr:helix-turn-helix domain-containing protein [Bacteroidota bacterium]